MAQARGKASDLRLRLLWRWLVESFPRICGTTGLHPAVSVQVWTGRTWEQVYPAVNDKSITWAVTISKVIKNADIYSQMFKCSDKTQIFKYSQTLYHCLQSYQIMTFWHCNIPVVPKCMFQPTITIPWHWYCQCPGIVVCLKCTSVVNYRLHCKNCTTSFDFTWGSNQLM